MCYIVHVAMLVLVQLLLRQTCRILTWLQRMLIMHSGFGDQRARDSLWQRTIALANKSDCNKDTNKRCTRMFVTVAVKSLLAQTIAKQLQP